MGEGYLFHLFDEILVDKQGGIEYKLDTCNGKLWNV